PRRLPAWRDVGNHPRPGVVAHRLAIFRPLHWSSYADRNSPHVRRVPGSLLVWQRVHDPVDGLVASSRAVLGVPPLLYGQAEAGRHGWTGRALRAPRRQGEEARQGRLDQDVLGNRMAEP